MLVLDELDNVLIGLPDNIFEFTVDKYPVLLGLLKAMKLIDIILIGHAPIGLLLMHLVPDYHLFILNFSAVIFKLSFKKFEMLLVFK